MRMIMIRMMNSRKMRTKKTLNILIIVVNLPLNRVSMIKILVIMTLKKKLIFRPTNPL